jgi:hypothetical protein
VRLVIAAGAGLVAGCVLPSFDAAGKTCSAENACPLPFVCVLAGDAGTCAKDPCGADPRLGASCDAGLGSCLRQGVFACAAEPGSATAAPVVCNAVPGLPDAEVCNGLDDDCDGIVDDHLIDALPCELDAGVCAGKLHACIDGGYEPRCTALSYGTAFQPVETLCDGLDNDCDGRVDVSRVVPLPVGNGSMEWAADSSGVQVVYAAGDAVFWERLDTAFHLVAGPMALSDAGGRAYWPVVRASGPSSVAAWVEEEPPGTQWLRLAAVDASGQLGWPGAAGVLRTGLAIAQPPRLAVSASAGLALAVWIASDGGAAVQWLLPLDAGAVPEPSVLEGPMPVDTLDVAPGPGGASAVFTVVEAMGGSVPGLLNLGWLSSNDMFLQGSPVYSAQADQYVDARAAADTASYVDLADGGARTLYWLSAQPLMGGPATPQFVSSDVMTAAIVATQGGSFVAWETASSGIRGSFFDVNGAVASFTFLPAGFQAPLLTWNGSATFFSLAAGSDGGGISAENICQYDGGS